MSEILDASGLPVQQRNSLTLVGKSLARSKPYTGTLKSSWRDRYKTARAKSSGSAVRRDTGKGQMITADGEGVFTTLDEIDWVSGFTIYEVDRTRVEHVSRDAFRASVTLQCLYSERDDIANALIYGLVPYPFNSYATCQSVRMRPHPAAVGDQTANGQSYDYNLCWLDVEYSTQSQADNAGDPEATILYSETLEPSVEFITLDHKDFIWDSDNKALQEGEAPGKRRYLLTINRVLYSIDPPLPIDLLNLCGKVNDDSYASASLGLTFAEETLLFIPPVLSRTVKSDGSGNAFQINCKAAYKPEGWNKYWRSATQDYDRILRVPSADEYNSYEPADFSNLFFA